MSPRTACLLAGVGLAVPAVAALAALVIGVRLGVEDYVDNWLLLMVVFLGFAAIGWLIATRRPAHPIGWLLLAFGGVPMLVSLVQVYAAVALEVRPGALPAGPEATWLGEVPWGAVWSLLALVLLLFPTGRPAADRWRWVVAVVSGNAALSVLLSAVALWPARLTVDRFEDLEPAAGIIGTAMGLSSAVVGLGIVAGAVSLIDRHRAADEVERAQLRWLAFASPFLVLAVALVAARNVTGWRLPEQLDQFAVVPIAVVPIAMGVAILRYRLYEIDRVVSRTVTYLVLSGVLVGVYAAAALLLGRLAAPFGATSDLAVAGATLAAAALFSPVRGRVQGAVDRRFNRARFDAQREVDAFRARLRDEVDLAEVGAALRTTIGRTVQPAATSLWLRDAPTFAAGAPPVPTGGSA